MTRTLTTNSASHRHTSSTRTQGLTLPLKVEFPQFTVPWFVDMLKDEPCDGDVFDMLFALSDFQEFKEMMVSFKKEKEVESGERSKEMAVCRMRIYSEEQEDGDARPDLDDLASLSITPLAN